MRRGNVGVDQEVDLGDAAGDRGRQRQHQQPADIGREPRPAKADLDAGIAHGHPDDRQLHEARCHHAPGEAIADGNRILADIPGIAKDADEDDVEEDRGDRRGEIAVQRIQHARHHRGERHAGEIGEHDRREDDGIAELRRIVGETGGNQVADDERHRQFHGHRQEQKHGEENAEDFLGEAPRPFHAVRLDLLGKERHEGGIEGALGKEPAKGIGQAEGRVEGIGDRPCAERCRHEGFADEAEQPAAERGAADGCKFLDQTHVSAFVVL
ncbi:hypothetical protein D3C72_1425150 [compost metagenome]